MKTSMRYAAAGTLVALAIAAAGIGMGMGGMGERDAAAPSGVPAADGKSYTIDPVHSNVVFKIKHMNVSNFYGRFNKVTGSFTLGDMGSVDVRVDAASVDTNNSKRDDHVKSPDFLSVKEFGEITFKGTDLKKAGDTWTGSGELMLHGVKKTISVELHQVGAAAGSGGKPDMAGVEASFTIKRTDYGIKSMVGPLGDDVTLWVSLEGGTK